MSFKFLYFDDCKRFYTIKSFILLASEKANTQKWIDENQEQRSKPHLHIQISVGKICTNLHLNAGIHKYSIFIWFQLALSVSSTANLPSKLLRGTTQQFFLLIFNIWGSNSFFKANVILTFLLPSYFICIIKMSEKENRNNLRPLFPHRVLCTTDRVIVFYELRTLHASSCYDSCIKMATFHFYARYIYLGPILQ